MKHLLLTTIAAAVLVGSTSLHLNTNVEPNLELTKEGLLVDSESQAPYTGKQSAEFGSRAKYWEGSVEGRKTAWTVHVMGHPRLQKKSDQVQGWRTAWGMDPVESKR